MATKRRRGNGAWEYTVRRKGVLPKPLYFTFDSEFEGDTYVAKLEAMLDKGQVPAELLEKPSALTMGDLINACREVIAFSESSQDYLNVAAKRWGETYLANVNYKWGEKLVEGLKDERLSVAYIGRLVRLVRAVIDWGIRAEYSAVMTMNPLRLLPKKFAMYAGREVVSEGRSRRLEKGEEEAILALLKGDRRLMFVLAVETAMRLSEIYSLTEDQVDLGRRTIFLEKTKNGDKRQVPLSSVALVALEGFKGFGYGEVSKKTTAKLSQYFGRVTKKAHCVDLHFHDLRHEAVCRLYERTRLSDVQIAKITGHRDPRMLMRYANLRGSDLAEALW